MTNIENEIDLKERLVHEFRSFELSMNGSRNLFINRIRREAMQKFESLGFPTIRHEEWKYANLAQFLGIPFKSRPLEPGSTTNESQFGAARYPSETIILVNGFSGPKGALSVDTPDVELFDFAGRSVAQDSVFENSFGSLASFTTDSLIALNTAMSQDGVVLRIKRNRQVEKAIRIVLVSDASHGDVASHYRLLVHAESGSNANIVIESHSIGQARSLTTLVSEIFLEPNANLHLYSVQNDSASAVAINAHHVKLDRDSRFSGVTVTTGGEFVRNNVTTILDGENSEANLYGIAHGGGRRLVDNHTLVDHARPHCQSNELYKYVLDDRSIGVFNGKVYVRQDAQKTNAYQSNKTILLSDTATINSKPQLEIFADDVKCSHGATSGSLDEEALFYLMARGIGKEKAQALLLHAFAGEVLEHIHIDELRQDLDALIAHKLHDDK